MLYNDSDTLLKMAFDTVGNVLQFVSLKSWLCAYASN